VVLLRRWYLNYGECGITFLQEFEQITKCLLTRSAKFGDWKIDNKLGGLLVGVERIYSGALTWVTCSLTIFPNNLKGDGDGV
jgi:hypothetical protein